MKISDLQDMLRLIRQLLASAGGKGTGEIEEFSAALEPFRSLTPKQFTNELRKLTEQPKPAKTGAKLGPAEVDAVIQELRDLYERAGSPSTTQAEMTEKTEKLDRLQKKDVLRAAEAIGLQGMKNKTSAIISEEIRKRIEGRMGAAQRMSIIDVVVGSPEEDSTAMPQPAEILE